MLSYFVCKGNTFFLYMQIKIEHFSFFFAKPIANFCRRYIKIGRVA